MKTFDVVSMATVYVRRRVKAVNEREAKRKAGERAVVTFASIYKRRKGVHDIGEIMVIDPIMVKDHSRSARHRRLIDERLRMRASATP